MPTVGDESKAGNIVKFFQNLYDIYRFSKPLIQNAISPSASQPSGPVQPVVGLREDLTQLCSDQASAGIYAVMDCCQKRVAIGLDPGDFCRNVSNTLQQPGAADVPEALMTQAEEVLSGRAQTQSLGNQLMSLFIPSQQRVQQFNNVLADMQNIYNKQQQQSMTLRLGSTTTQQTSKQFPVLRLGSLSGQGAALNAYSTVPVRVSYPSYTTVPVTSASFNPIPFVPQMFATAQNPVATLVSTPTGMNMNNNWAQQNIKW
jgi:hypothetical protein